MNAEVLPDAEAVARRAAAVIAEQARDAVSARGRFLLAVSGGKSPNRMFDLLALEEVPWEAVHLFQVDERVAPPGDDARNLTHLTQHLLTKVPAAHVYPMPVEEPDLAAAAARYEAALQKHAGTPATFDLVHLGLGADGHTASLVPGDPVLDVMHTDIAITARYQGHCRMTMTYPLIGRSRHLLWVVTGQDKANAAARLRDGDSSIPAGRIDLMRSRLILDAAAAFDENEVLDSHL